MNAIATRGRPSLYSDELAQEICDRLIQGESLNEICKTPGFPAEATVRGWALDPLSSFSAKYAIARDLQADVQFDLAWEIAQNATIEDAHVARLRVDTIKWRVGRMSPRKYGDRRILAGDPDAPLVTETRETIDVSALDPEEREVFRELVRRAKARQVEARVVTEDGE